MNEVPHSEHVISRSGIAVSPRKRMEVHFLLFGALALRFFQPLGRGAKAALFSNARQKALASRRLIVASVLQWFGLFNFFITWGRGNVWQMIFKEPSSVARAPQWTTGSCGKMAGMWVALHPQRSLGS